MNMKHVGLLAVGAVLTLAGFASAGPLDTRKARAPDPVRPGAAGIYDKWCATCHAPGNEFAGTVSLAVKYKGSVPAALLDRTDLTEDTVKYFVRHGVAIMPQFRKTEITDAELEKLAHFVSHQGKEPRAKKSKK